MRHEPKTLQQFKWSVAEVINRLIDINGDGLIVLRHQIWELGLKSQTILQDTCDDQWMTRVVCSLTHWLVTVSTDEQLTRCYVMIVCSQMDDSTNCACDSMIWQSHRSFQLRLKHNWGHICLTSHTKSASSGAVLKPTLTFMCRRKHECATTKTCRNMLCNVPHLN